jgi:hypothetical protein
MRSTLPSIRFVQTDADKSEPMESLPEKGHELVSDSFVMRPLSSQEPKWIGEKGIRMDGCNLGRHNLADMAFRHRDVKHI